MSKLIEWGKRIFGEGTPKHNALARIDGNTLSFHLDIEQPKGPMTVRYKPGTDICFESEGYEYRPFGEEEVIFAKEIHFYGEGMSNGTTLEDKYFKALDDPIEVTPLEVIDGGN